MLEAWHWQLLLAVTSLVCAYAWWYFSPRRVRMRRLAARMPGPPALPLLGNALTFMAKPEELLNIIGGYFDTYGQYVKFWLGPDLNVCIKNPADIRTVLTSNKVNQKGPLYQIMKRYIGSGILSGGPTWRNHRKIATPAYSKKSVAQFSQVFNREGQILAEKILRRDPEVIFDVYKDVVLSTTQCVCQTLMGLSKEDSKSIKRLEELIFVTQTMYNFMFDKMTHWWLQIPIIFWLTGRKKTEDYYVKLIDDFAADVVSKKRKTVEKKAVDEEEKFNIVDCFINSGELTEKDIRFETFTLFTTSQEASAKILSAVLLFLAHLPTWQDRVYQEIVDILGPEDDDVTEEQLKRLEHLDMVFKEALRFLSIAAFIQRTVEEEISIDNGKLTLPVGASVIIPIHMLHRDPRYWERPHTVDPARFLPERVHNRDPNAFVPFSLGAMDCLGRVYATALIKTLAVRVLRRVELHAPPGSRLEDLHLHVAISVRFAQGYKLRATPRRKGN